MENWSSFLFGGINFDRNKFADDKKETDSKVEDLPLFHNGSLQPEERSVSIKKRKRKPVASESMERFSVFKSSKTAPVVKKENEKDEDKLSKEKKELYR
ncbi:hypothetical protein SLE2022_076880 [Rubroshorea leprosula]